MNEELKNILKRVNQLFTKYGIKSVTMDDISHELAISKKTLYQYVKDKGELVSLIIDMEFEDKNKCFSQIERTYVNAIDELFQVQKIVNSILKEYSPSSVYDLKKYYPEMHQKMNLMRREKMMEYTLANLKRGKAEGLYRASINEMLITKLQVQRVENTFDNDFLTVEEMITPQIFIEMFNYHIRGIATEKGLIELEKVIDKLKTDYLKTNINI
jgi:TetR/AcrR family transcriptional regulator, cholesterol catabolism regulator